MSCGFLAQSLRFQLSFQVSATMCVSNLAFNKGLDRMPKNRGNVRPWV